MSKKDKSNNIGEAPDVPVQVSSETRETSEHFLFAVIFFAVSASTQDEHTGIEIFQERGKKKKGKKQKKKKGKPL